MISLKSPQEIQKMRKAGAITANILLTLIEKLAPGISAADLDAMAESLCRDNGVIPAFKNYQGFQNSICFSVNHEVVHGIPSRKKVVQNGDVVSIDFGVIYDGFFGDSALTSIVGVPSGPEVTKLVETTRKSLNNGLQQCKVGNRLFDISHAVQICIESAGFSVVREFVGHGIGRHLHEDPQVPNFGPAGKGMPLREGLVLAIEPMVAQGSAAVKVEADGWTAVTQDGSLAAHFEHTVAITKDGPMILTLP